MPSLTVENYIKKIYHLCGESTAMAVRDRPLKASKVPMKTDPSNEPQKHIQANQMVIGQQQGAWKTNAFVSEAFLGKYFEQLTGSINEKMFEQIHCGH